MKFPWNDVEWRIAFPRKCFFCYSKHYHSFSYKQIPSLLLKKRIVNEHSCKEFIKITYVFEVYSTIKIFQRGKIWFIQHKNSSASITIFYFWAENCWNDDDDVGWNLLTLQLWWRVYLSQIPKLSIQQHFKNCFMLILFYHNYLFIVFCLDVITIIMVTNRILPFQLILKQKNLLNRKIYFRSKVIVNNHFIWLPSKVLDKVLFHPDFDDIRLVCFNGLNLSQLVLFYHL